MKHVHLKLKAWSIAHYQARGERSTVKSTEATCKYATSASPIQSERVLSCPLHNGLSWTGEVKMIAHGSASGQSRCVPSARPQPRRGLRAPDAAPCSLPTPAACALVSSPCPHTCICHVMCPPAPAGTCAAAASAQHLGGRARVLWGRAPRRPEGSRVAGRSARPRRPGGEPSPPARSDGASALGGRNPRRILAGASTLPCRVLRFVPSRVSSRRVGDPGEEMLDHQQVSSYVLLHCT